MVLKDTLAAELAPPFGSEEAAPPSSPVVPRRSRRLALVVEGIGLLLALALAGALRLWDLEQNGWGTTYYTAAVRSGLESWHNFFYNSFDPGGYVSVDKPPVSIWIQVLSCKLFGFTQLSVLAPQAVMGILSVLILWHLVRRQFGPLGAFLAAMVLAVMPISVAVERTSNTDACLAFLLLVAGWALLRATEKGNMWLLLLSMVLVGIAFNAKMLAAFVVLPTFYLVYLLGAPVSWRSRLGDLALATFVVFGVAFSWAVAYDLTPEEERPYADSTQNNSMLTLIVQHNGLERFVRRGRGRFGQGPRPAPGAGQAPRTGNRPDLADPAGPFAGPVPQQPGVDGQLPQDPGQQPADPSTQRRGARARGQAPGNPFDPPQDGNAGRRGNRVAGAPFPGGAPFGPGGGSGGGGPGGAFRGPGGRGGIGWGGGSPVGLWRFAHPHMAGQVLWFFPLALLGLIVAGFQTRGSWKLKPPRQMLLLWLGWLGTYFVVYSFAGGIFHDHYILTMAAPMAALTGIGGAALCKSFAQGSWRSILLPLAILLTAGWQALIWLNYPELAKWAVPALLIAATATGLGLLALRGSWWGLIFTAGVLTCVGWLWMRDSTAPDVLAVAAAKLDEGRTALRQAEGWDSLKQLYTKFSPDVGTLLPDLRRPAALVSPTLLWGCGIAGGCSVLVFLLARWRPLLAKGTVAVLTLGFLVLLVSPAVWALTPVWMNGGMLPAADVSVFARMIRDREQRAQEAARGAALALRASQWAMSSSLTGIPAPLVATDLAVFTRSRRGAAGFGRGFGGFAGGFGGARGFGGGGGFGGFGGGPGAPGVPRRDNERARQERQKFVNFLKANQSGERWALAVSGQQQAATYIIEDDLSVLPLGGFGGSPILGTDPDEIKARLTKMVEDGQIRFFQMAGGRGGFRGGPGGMPAGFGRRGQPGGGGPGAPQGTGRAGGGRAAAQGAGRTGGGPPAGFGRGTATVSQWLREQVDKGKAKQVDRRLYGTEAPADAAPRDRGFGRFPGMMGGSADLYDLRPELGLREPAR